MEREGLVSEPGDDFPAVIVVKNHVGEVAPVESVTVDNLAILHAVALIEHGRRIEYDRRTLYPVFLGALLAGDEAKIL